MCPPYAREKLENVLAAVAAIADIAKDPETPGWYKRNLRRHVYRAFHDGVKVLLWSYGRVDDWNGLPIQQPTEHGTLGLAALLNGLGISHSLATGEPAVEPEDDEDREPPHPPGAPKKIDDPWASRVRQSVLKHTFSRLADRGRNLSEAEARLLVWIAYHIAGSEYEDIGLLAREFLASDVGLAKDEGAAALRGLVEKKLVEEMRELAEASERSIALRIVVDGLNDRRHDPSVH